MGSFFSSYSVHGAAAPELRDRLGRWLGTRGFEEMARPRLFPVHPEHERGALVCVRGVWATLLYSALDEEERLAYELAKLGRPVLHLWLHDSDMWGYELVEGQRVVAAFSSRPGLLRRRATDHGPVDVAALCATCAIEDLERQLIRLHRKRSLFMDGVCLSFAHALGVPAAAASYGSALVGEWETGEGAEVEELWFRHSDFDPMAGFSLHRVRARLNEETGAVPAELAEQYRRLAALVGEDAARQALRQITAASGRGGAPRPGELAPEALGGWQQIEEDLGPDEAARLRAEVLRAQQSIERRMRGLERRVGCLRTLLRPLGWLTSLIARGWSGWHRQPLAGAGDAAGPGAADDACCRQDGDWVVNRRHGCRVRLAPDARWLDPRSVQLGGDVVLAFRAAGLDVWCVAERPDSVRRRLGWWPPRAVIDEQDLEVDGHPAKRLFVRIRRGSHEDEQLLVLVQAGEGVYVFQSTVVQRIDAGQRRAFEDTVASFRLDG